MLLGVDVGGTFTDAVLVVDGRFVTAKAATTPEDESVGVMRAIAAALQDAGRSATGVVAFGHGTTISTNALLEGRSARTALIATEGFTDLVELGRQARPELYRLCVARPAALVPPGRRLGAPERMTPAGPLRRLDPAAATALADAVATAGVEAVAVVLLHAYRHPAHEAAIGAALAARCPGVHVSLSHEVVGTFREYERAATTEIDAALSPLLAGYLDALVDHAAAAGLPAPAIMQSSGGLATAADAARHAAFTVLSGPAGGAAGAAHIAVGAGHPDVLCFDMGGTSCDVCVIDAGRVREAAGGEIGGHPIALPTLDIHTVGAGGGSIAWHDPGGALRVGPASSGSEPGPACYGRGGTEPTVTDADLVLGYLDPATPLADGVQLDREAALRAVGGLADELGLELERCAEGIIAVANAEMARALRVMTVERGIDPRGYALLAFGGAGPMHAIAVADELGMDVVLCPRESGVLSALGLVVSERRHDVQRSVLLSGHRLTQDAVAEELSGLVVRARAMLDDPSAPIRVVYDLRYVGQSFELPVPGGERPFTPRELHDAFAAAHQERYGFTDGEADVELVTIRATAAVAGPEVGNDGAGRESAGATACAGVRSARFDGRREQAAVWPGGPAPGTRVRGPAVCDLATSTLVVPPAWGGEADRDGTIVLRRVGR